ncbi:fungal-specific transcription factor domain-containing protein [Pseudomassariella vexata]|uniref:Fungal-specific transcription factor domain-domain-containing protein n=1 Tax=Pseudomassariella vexata TaxID=1141098 RepID=A0A1Y2EF86_9PEZI|nr:fungal-specific transcription factor domain-containing protein [Pseudomassariella vexata]ORY70230.1 fungal-specific transcription factor domain-domain-containing protein [Pseudomassariella vexata]
MPIVTCSPQSAGAGEEPSGAHATEKAPQACYSCRKQKRKCDKAIPACSLCSRMARRCDYSETQPPPTAEDIIGLQLKLVELENRLDYTGAAAAAEATLPVSHTPQLLSRESLWQSCPSTFPSAFFLDSRVYQWSGLMLPKPTSDIPHDVLSCIGSAEEIEQTVSDYFGDIHPWFPMTSRKLVTIVFPSWEAGSDVALLLLTMKLITSQPQDGFTAAENFLYTASKSFAALLEATGTTSLHYLQGLILIALYEYGQGIYPPAWMTVGQCVRYAEFLGLPSYKDTNAALGPFLTPFQATWAESEERRRVWWAVYILDKLVSLGSCKRPMCPEPLPTDLTPTDDRVWDSGEPADSMQTTVASAAVKPQSPFARLCQSALLVSRVLHHHAVTERHRLSGEHVDYNEFATLTDTTQNLHETLEADFRACPASYFSLLPARCVAFSASLNVHANYAYGDWLNCQLTTTGPWTDQELTVKLTAQKNLQKIAAHVRDFASNLFALLAQDEDVVKTPPMVLDAVYAAAVTFLDMWKESGGGDVVAEGSLETLRKCLIRLSGRWRRGRELLGILETRKMGYGLGDLGGVVSGCGSGSGIPLAIPSMGV